MKINKWNILLLCIVKYWLFVSVLLSLFCITGFALAEQWSETKPDTIYLEKMQYRSRGQERTQSSSPTMDGWFCYDQKPGEWGEWIYTGASHPESSTDCEVLAEITYSTESSTIGYRYKHYRYANANGSIYFTYSSNYPDNMGFSGYWETRETSIADRLGTYKIYDGVQSYGAAQDFWFYEEEIKSDTVVSSTVYKYRTRPRIYYFYKWLNWSEWQDDPIEATEETDVQTRMLYAVDKSKLSTGIRLESVSEVPLLSSTGCQIQYQGNGHDAEWDSSDASIVSVSSSGYLSAHKAGTAVISVVTASDETYTFSVVVKDWPGLMLPQQLTQIESEAFEGGAFEYVDLTSGNVTSVGDKAFSGNNSLRLIRVDNRVSFSNQVFSGSDNIVFACEEEGPITDYAKSNGIPFYIIGPEQDYIAVSSITLNQEALTLKQYEYFDLAYEIIPQNATNQSVIWSSSDPSIVSVPFPGCLQALAEGTAKITVASKNDHNVKAECVVTVVPVLVDSVYMTPQDWIMYYGDTVTLTATAFPYNATNRELFWTSSDPFIATVTQDGVVTGVGEGTATIIARSTDGSNQNASCAVTVRMENLIDDSKFTSVYVDNITETNATLHAKVSLPHNPDRAGYYFGTSLDNVELCVTEDSSEMPLNNQIIWYNLNKWGKKLKPGTTYYYQFFIVYDGVIYRSDYRSFKTAGTAGVLVDDSMFTSVYADGITETNAVIHTKVSLPYNPSTAGYYFGTDINNLALSATEDASNMPLNNQIIWYDLNKWGKTLSPGTTYYYQFYIVYDDIMYKTTIKSFTTSGYASENHLGTHYYMISQGEELQLTVSSLLDNPQIIWTSTDPQTVSVTATGKISGVYGGTAMIVAEITSGNQKETEFFAITVDPVTLRVVIIANYEYEYDGIRIPFISSVIDALEGFSAGLEEDIIDFINVLRGKYIFSAEQKKVIGETLRREPLTTAEALQSVFMRYALDKGEIPEVHLFTDIKKGAALSKIPEFFSDSDDNDINIFYFSGHGSESTKNLCVYDNTHISPSDLKSAFSGIKGNNVIFLDACFSGSFIGGSGFSGGNYYVLTACRASEKSMSSHTDIAYTGFGYYLIKALGVDPSSRNPLIPMPADYEGNNDGIITFIEVCNYVSSHMTSEMAQHNHTQHITQLCPSGKESLALIDRR